MALIKCRECSAQITSEAKSCPHCGAEPRKGLGCLSAVGIILIAFTVIVFAALSIDQAKKTNQEQAETKRINALPPAQRAEELRIRTARDQVLKRRDEIQSSKFACMAFIEKSLHSPSSADFDRSDTFKAWMENDDIYYVKAGVRAENAFGAIRHSQFECRMTHGGGKFFLVTINEAE